MLYLTKAVESLIKKAHTVKYIGDLVFVQLFGVIYCNFIHANCFW